VGRGKAQAIFIKIDGIAVAREVHAMRFSSLLLVGLCGSAEALHTPALVPSRGTVAPLRAARFAVRHAAPVAYTPAPEVPKTALSPEALAMLGAGKTPPPFKKIMAANRAEIAVRIMRAATELNSATVAIYGHEDRFSQHRWGADQSFLLEKRTPDATAIASYLDMAQIIKIAKEQGVDAIHPGYGFLSETPAFAQVRRNTIYHPAHTLFSATHPLWPPAP